MATLDFTPVTPLLMTFSDGHSVVLPSNETSAYIKQQAELGNKLIFTSLIA